MVCGNCAVHAGRAPHPTLVVTPSHDLTERLQAAVGAQADLLIRAGAWAGLDTPTRWRTVVIPRVPFGAPVVVDGEAVTSYLDAKVTASPHAPSHWAWHSHARCGVYRGGRMHGSNSGQLCAHRFAASWSARQVFEEGTRQELVLSAAERDPGLRKAALRRYGTACQLAGCTINQAHLLDVHHLQPVSEGTRRTTLNDVTVLCANHRRQAHFEMKTTQTLTMEAVPVTAGK